MYNIIKNDDFTTIDNGDFVYCDCEIDDRKNHKQDNYYGCYYIDTIFSNDKTDLAQLNKLVKNYEIYDVDSWQDLNKFNIECTIKDHFLVEDFYDQLVYSAIPINVLINTGDIYDHEFEFKYKDNFFDGKLILLMVMMEVVVLV